MTDSHTTIVGNVTREPELRFTGGGKGVCSFAVAVGRRWKPQNSDKWEEVTTFYNVSCWDQLAENVAASVRKGTRVVITGVVEMREYETRDGEKGRSLEIRPDEIGVSLRWARVDIEKVTRERDGEERDTSPRNTRQPEPVYGDEEPF